MTKLKPTDPGYSEEGFTALPLSTDELYKTEKYKLVPQELKNNHRFCAGCGKEMRLSRTVQSVKSYDKKTGAETKGADVVKLTWVCQTGGEGCDRVEL